MSASGTAALIGYQRITDGNEGVTGLPAFSKSQNQCRETYSMSERMEHEKERKSFEPLPTVSNCY